MLQFDFVVPRRPMSAYLAFSNERRGALKRLYPSANNRELSRMLAKAWKDAGPEIKEPYLEEEYRLREEYHEKMKPFKQTRKQKKGASILEGLKKEQAAKTDSVKLAPLQMPPILDNKFQTLCSSSRSDVQPIAEPAKGVASLNGSAQDVAKVPPSSQLLFGSLQQPRTQSTDHRLMSLLANEQRQMKDIGQDLLAIAAAAGAGQANHRSLPSLMNNTSALRLPFTVGTPSLPANSLLNQVEEYLRQEERKVAIQKLLLSQHLQAPLRQDSNLVARLRGQPSSSGSTWTTPTSHY